MNKLRRRKQRARRNRLRYWLRDDWGRIADAVFLGVDIGRDGGAAVVSRRRLDGTIEIVDFATAVFGPMKAYQAELLRALPRAATVQWPQRAGKTTAWDEMRKALEDGTLTIPKPCA